MSAVRLARWLLTGVVSAGSVAFVAANGSFLAAFAHGIGHTSPAPLAIGLALSAGAMANRGGLNRAAHCAAGLPVEPRSLIAPAAVGFTTDKLVRAGGAGSVAVFVRHGSARAYPRGTVIGACVIAALASSAALGLLLAAALVVLASTGHLAGWWLAAAVGFSVYIGAVGALALAAARWRCAVQRCWSRATRRWPWLVASLGLPIDPVGDIAAALRTARAHPSWARRTVGHAIVAKVLGAATLLCAARAAGAPVSLTGAVVVYATALFASMASLSPGGLGAVEASIGALLVSAGAGAAAGAVAVALFRILDLWLPMLVGALAAARFARLRRASGVTRTSPAPVELVAT